MGGCEEVWMNIYSRTGRYFARIDELIYISVDTLVLISWIFFSIEKIVFSPDSKH